MSILYTVPIFLFASLATSNFDVTKAKSIDEVFEAISTGRKAEIQVLPTTPEPAEEIKTEDTNEWSVWDLADIPDELRHPKKTETKRRARRVAGPATVGTGEAHADAIQSFITRLSNDFARNKGARFKTTCKDLGLQVNPDFNRFGQSGETFEMLSYTLPGVIAPKDSELSKDGIGKVLAALKQRNKALADTEPVVNTNFIASLDPDVLTFTRMHGDDNKVFVVANLSDRSVRVHYLRREPYIVGMVDVFTGDVARIPLTLAPWEFCVFSTK